MNIKNLYITIVSKVKEPMDKEVYTQAIEYMNKVNKKENAVNIWNDDEVDALHKEIRQKLTKTSLQLRKISKIKPLDYFIRQNARNVDELGKALMLKQSEFNSLCKECGFPEGMTKIDIMLDSKIVFCTIIPVDKAGLALALSQGKITAEKYDKLIAQLDE